MGSGGRRRYHSGRGREATKPRLAVTAAPSSVTTPSTARHGAAVAWLYDGTAGGASPRMLETVATVAPGCEVVVLSCETAAAAGRLPIRRFEPVIRLPLAGPELPPLSLPPALDVLQELESGGYGEIVVSAPGPMGLLGAAAAQLLGLPLTCIYDAGVPRLARELTGSPRIEDAAGDAMRWFCGLADRVLVHPQDQLAAEQQLGAIDVEIARRAA